MKNVTLSIGGDLAPGDVVGISYSNCIQFAWYVEQGAYGSLKYISFGEPKRTFDRFTKWQNNDPGFYHEHWKKLFAKGLIFKCFPKEYVIKFNGQDNRAFKVSNPEQFFKDAAIEVVYLEGKEILNKVNFPAK